MSVAYICSTNPYNYVLYLRSTLYCAESLCWEGSHGVGDLGGEQCCHGPEGGLLQLLLLLVFLLESVGLHLGLDGAVKGIN